MTENQSAMKYYNNINLCSSLSVVTFASYEQEGSLIKWLRENIGLSDLTVMASLREISNGVRIRNSNPWTTQKRHY